MKGQKQAVIELVHQYIPGFNPARDIALVMLTKGQLESLKYQIGQMIISGQIEYGKDASNNGEVFAYARAMVMNHLKKAKELNGNQIYGVGPAVVQSRHPKVIEGLNKDLLSDDLKAIVERLV